MKDWPKSRPEILKRLEQLCNVCRDTRAEFERLGKEWSSLTHDQLGDPHYAPVQTILWRFVNMRDDLESLERAAIKAVQGEEYTDEAANAQYDAIRDAMDRAGLSEEEKHVYEALYLERERSRRITYTDKSTWWENDVFGITEEEREWYREHEGNSWAKIDYTAPHKHTQKEVADMLGITQGRVSQLAKSAREKMFKETGWVG